MARSIKLDRLAESVSVVIVTTRRSSLRASMAMMLATVPSLPVLAQSSTPSDEATTLDTVSVIGVGSTRTTAAISADEIKAQVPGVAPQQLLATLPGVNVQTSDPFGLYEFSDTMRVRGFSADQLGVTLDGIPLETSDTREGGPISRYVSSENLADVQMSAGSGDVSQPAYHALGGAIRYYSRGPKGSDDWTGSASQTIGSYGLNRTFFRIDTPEWWEGGPVAYVSGSRIRGEVWNMDWGTQESDHFEAKIRQDFEKGSLTLSHIWNNRVDYDIPSYEFVDGKLEKTWTPLRYPSGDQNVDHYLANFWRNGRRDALTSISGNFLLTDNTGINFTGYYENKWAYGIGATSANSTYTQYANAIAGTPGRTDVQLDSAVYDEDGNVVGSSKLSRRFESMYGNRRGLTGSWFWETEQNKLEIGGWYENYDFSQTRPLYNVDSSGNILYDELPITIYYDRHFKSKVTQLYIKDTLHLLDSRLILEGGIKGLEVKRDFNGIANLDDFNNSTTRDVSRKDSDWFQPQFGASYNLTDSTQIFANYAENFSAVPRLALVAGSGTWSTVKPESSKNIDIGVRSDHGNWSGYVALYHVAYENRIVAISDPDPQVVDSTAYYNVGDVESTGLEISGLWRPAPHWRTGASLTFNRSKFKDDYYETNSDGTLTWRYVDGNTVPDSPKVMLSVNGGYEGEHLFANLDGKYTGKRYGDVLNNDEVDAMVIFNGSVGYQGTKDGFLAGGRLQLTIYNLTDDDDAIGSISTGVSSGSYTLIGPRTYYLSLSYDF
jgi:iron complex outermembrane receptor protein